MHCFAVENTVKFLIYERNILALSGRMAVALLA